VRAFFRDHLGSAAYVTGPNKRQAYEPFGKEILSGNVATDEFTSKEYRGATGMYFFGARWYDAEAGRFAGVDPLVARLMNPQELNAYSYTLNEPINHIDPTGLFTMCTPFGNVCFGDGKAGYHSNVPGGFQPFSPSWISPSSGQGPTSASPLAFSAIAHAQGLDASRYEGPRFRDEVTFFYTGNIDGVPEFTLARSPGVYDGRLSLGHLISAGAFVGNRGVDAAAGAGIFFSDDAVGGAVYVAGAMNAGDIVSEGKTRGFELGIDHNILVMRKGFERVPDLSTVSLSFGISIKFFFENHGQPLDLLSIRPNDLEGFSLGLGLGIGASIVDSIGRGGSFPVLK
jgi:RHS repeat-associated protein